MSFKVIWDRFVTRPYNGSAAPLSLPLASLLIVLSFQVTWARSAEATGRKETKCLQGVKDKIIYRIYKPQIYSKLHGPGLAQGIDILNTWGIQLNWSFLPVFTWRWLHGLLDCLWLLFCCFCLRDSVSWRLLQWASPLLQLLFFLHLLLRFGSLHLQESKLHPQFNDGLSFLMNRLVQMVVLNLWVQRKEKGHFSCKQPATYVADESLIQCHLSLGSEKRMCQEGECF